MAFIAVWSFEINGDLRCRDLRIQTLAPERVGKTYLIANLKTFALAVLVIVSNVLGNCLLNIGVKHGKLVTLASVLRMVVSPCVIAGVLLLIAWMLLRMALLSSTPMTVVLPLTAGVAYAVTGGIGQFWFAEKVSARYDYGLLLILVGVVLVGTSACREEPATWAPATELSATTSAPEYQT